MKANSSANETRRPIPASGLPGALRPALRILREALLGSWAASCRRYGRRAEISALSDFELEDIGLRRPHIGASPFVIMRSPGDADAAR
jgi:uncharacterized protein YjiS (DUF1127 family)